MIMAIIIRLSKFIPCVAYPACDWRGARFGNETVLLFSTLLKRLAERAARNGFLRRY
jgi:hypothetical protein